MMDEKQLESLKKILDFLTNAVIHYPFNRIYLDLQVLKGYYDQEINKEITEEEHNDWHSQGDGWLDWRNFEDEGSRGQGKGGAQNNS